MQFKADRSDVNIMMASHTGSVDYNQGISFILSPSTTYEIYMRSNANQSGPIGNVTTITRVAMPPNAVSAEGVEKISTVTPKGVDLFLIGNHQLLFPTLLESKTVMGKNFGGISSSLRGRLVKDIGSCGGFTCIVSDLTVFSHFVFSDEDVAVFYIFARFTSAETTTQGYNISDFNQNTIRGELNFGVPFIDIPIR